MNDTISRQAAIDAREAQECQRAAQKRRYAFGNDEFSLEAAYHDCKLVFDGITDDDSFQEADTGLILYYANEIIYALHEALEGKGTNILSNDCISRQAAVSLAKDICVPNKEGSVYRHRCIDPDAIRELPSAKPEIIRCKDCKYCRKEDEYEYWCYGFCSPARLVRKDDFCSYGCKYE